MSTQAMSAASAVVLFGHGARNPEWARPMQRIRAHMLAEADAPAVELAFLEFMQPDLPAAVAALVAGGAARIAIVPVFLAQGGHLQRDLPLMLDEIRQRHPGCVITLARAAGEAEAVIAAMAGYARDCLQGD